MSPDEKFFFDLCGYIVVKDALSPEEVLRLNEAVDSNIAKLQERQDSLARGSAALAGSACRKEMGDLLSRYGHEMTPEQRAVLEPPYHPRLNRPVI